VSTARLAIIAEYAEDVAGILRSEWAATRSTQPLLPVLLPEVERARAHLRRAVSDLLAVAADIDEWIYTETIEARP